MKFQFEVEDAKAYDVVGEDIVDLPAIQVRYTHNGYQWNTVKLTPEEWLQVLPKINERALDIQKETT